MSLEKLKNELKEKLKAPSDNETANTVATEDTLTSRHFPTPFWKRFYDIECKLNNELAQIQITNITHIYNPIEYASDLHCAYLRKFLTAPKKLMFIGMNPGPNGMAQNGIPFGNIRTVRQLMRIEGQVKQPLSVHPKRPVTGLACTIEEPSGVRIWGLIEELSGSLDVFGQQCFIHSFCPLAFFDVDGKNITPSELKGAPKLQIRDICLKYLDQEIELVQPEIVVSIGNYVGDSVKKLAKQTKYSNIRFMHLAHPSPRSINNNNWPEKAKKFIEENNLIKYIQNQS